MLDLTIIIPNYNTRELLKNCIQSIYDHTRGISFEIICLDDKSPDGSADMVAQCFPQVVLVRNEQKQLYTKNNNLGLKMSRARYACLLNSDTKLISNAFQILVEFMDTHPDAAACGPKLLNPDMSTQSCVRRFAGLGTMIFQGLNWHRFFPRGRVAKEYYASEFDYSREQVVESLGTTAFVVRRSTWENAGMLDQRFSLSMVDIAYNLMLKRKGYKVYYTPAAEVIHFGGQSINQSAKEKIMETHQALLTFSNDYEYFGSNCLIKGTVRCAIKVRCWLKLAEFHLSSDKRVIKGPGAPKLEHFEKRWSPPPTG